VAQRETNGAKKDRRLRREGAASIMWAALQEDTPSAPTGGFFRDGRAIPW
jgi:hypothetical protein